MHSIDLHIYIYIYIYVNTPLHSGKEDCQKEVYHYTSLVRILRWSPKISGLPLSTMGYKTCN